MNSDIAAKIEERKIHWEDIKVRDQEELDDEAEDEEIAGHELYDQMVKEIGQLMTVVQVKTPLPPLPKVSSPKYHPSQLKLLLKLGYFFQPRTYSPWREVCRL